LNKVVGKKTQGSKEVIKQQDNNNDDTNKNQQQQQQRLSLSTTPPSLQTLFSNRKTLLEVAIELDLRESEATISIKSIGS
jgi:hypothetical protein